jgi:chromosome segregation ATPase
MRAGGGGASATSWWARPPARASAWPTAPCAPPVACPLDLAGDDARFTHAEAGSGAQAKWWWEWWQYHHTRNEHAAVTNERNQAQNLRNDAWNRRAAAESELRQAERQRDAVLNELRVLQGQLNPILSQRQEAERQRDQLRGAIAAANAATSTAQQATTSATSTRKQLEAQLAADNAAIADLRKEMVKVQRDMEAVRKERDELSKGTQTRIAALRKQAADLDARIVELRTKIGAQRTSNANSVAQLRAQETAAQQATQRLRLSIDNLNGRAANLTARITRLQDRLDQYQAGLAQRLEVATRRVEDERRTLLQRKSEFEKARATAENSRTVAEAHSADYRQRINATVAAHAALVKQRGDEITSLRRAMVSGPRLCHDACTRSPPPPPACPTSPVRVCRTTR